MRFQPLLAALIATAMLHAGTALAQQSTAPATPGAGPGPGPGGGGPGPGGGPRGPRGPYYGPDYTPGWSMMTPQERDEHRQRMQSAKTPEECQKIMDDHRKWMAERAKERGVTNAPGPRHNACANWRS